MARKSPKQRKKERQQEKQRSQQTYIIFGVALVAVLGAIIFALTSLPTDAVIPEDVSTKYANFKTSTTDEGFPLLGSTEAPIQVREFSSFSCPGCMDFHRSVFPGLIEYIERGEINFVYVPLQTGSIPNQAGSARTAICAGEQGMFWEMHDVLFFWHETYGNAAFQNGRIRTGVQELGLNSGEFNRCFDSNSTDTILAAAVQEGVASTPTITVNGAPVEASLGAIQQAIESALPVGTFEPGIISDEDIEESEMPDEEETTEDGSTDEMAEEEATEEPEAMEEESSDEDMADDEESTDTTDEDAEPEATEESSE